MKGDVLIRLCGRYYSKEEMTLKEAIEVASFLLIIDQNF